MFRSYAGFSVVIILVLLASNATADVGVAWGAGGTHYWTNAARWGLDDRCGLYPTNGMPMCCQGCQGDPRWSVQMNQGTGPIMDVDSVLVGFHLLQGPMWMDGHTLTVTEIMTFGDSSSATPEPSVRSANFPGTLINQGTCTVYENAFFLNLEVINRGSWSIEDGAGGFGPAGRGTFHNAPGALLTFAGNGSMRNRVGGPHALINDGRLLKTQGGVSRLEANFTQAQNGTMHIIDGALELVAPSHTYINGSIQIAQNGTLVFSGGAVSHDIHADVYGGTVKFGSQPPSPVNVYGNYQVAHTANTSSDVMFWGTARTGTLDLLDSRGRLGGLVDISQALNWLAGTVHDGTLAVLGTAIVGSSSATAILDNALVRINKDAEMVIDQRGLLGVNAARIRNDGTVTLNNDTPLEARPAGSAEFVNHGTFRKVLPGAAVIAWNFSNANGVFQMLDGMLTMRGDYVQTDGFTLLDGSTLRMGANPRRPLEIQGGTLGGSGLIEGSVNISDATVAPGLLQPILPGTAQLGALTIAGGTGDAFSLGHGTLAQFEIGGRVRGTEYDAVVSNTPMTFSVGGTLNVLLVNGFENEITRDDQFVIFETVRHPIHGTFSNAVNGARLWARNTNGDILGTFSVHYGPGSTDFPTMVVLKDFRFANADWNAQVVNVTPSIPQPTYNHELSSAEITALSTNPNPLDRAGLTRMTLFVTPDLTVGLNPRRTRDGKFAYWIHRLELLFGFREITVWIAREYAEGSCEYNVTRGHEDEHVAVGQRLVEEYYGRIRRAMLEFVPLPTEQEPLWVSSEAEGESEIDKIESSVVQGAIAPLRAELVEKLRQENRELDSRENYRRVHDQCTDW